ncbi:MAG: HlyD family efflux transporter periplasmic adaptor subunit [Ktedonobacteraceae bacterium]
MRRAILIPVLVVLAILAIAGGIGYYIYNSYTFYSTDDAQVNGQIVNISAPGNGQLATLTVKQGDKVTAGQTIGSVTLTGAGANAAGSTQDLTSPIAGTIVQVPAVQGQGVAAGLTVAQVTDLNNVNVIAYVDENTINNVSTGQQVDVKVDAFSGTTYTGHVQQIVQATAGSFSLLPTQDNASGNFTKVGQRVPVLVSLNGNGGNDLVPGMSAEVTIHLH